MRTMLFIAALLFTHVDAFTWEPLVFPEGNQSYTIQVTSSDSSYTFDIGIVQTGDLYDVTYSTSQTGVPYSDLSSAAFGGTVFGGLGAGMFFFGPAFMMMPLFLGNQDIAVTDSPILLMAGAGTIYMQSTSQVAGLTCVDIRMDLGQGDDIQSFHFGLAENVPFPCYSEYGDGNDTIRIELINVSF